MQDYTFTVKHDGVGERIDHYLVKVLPKKKVSRTVIKNLINSGDILLNGKMTKPHHHLQCDDAITVHIPPPSDTTGLEPEKIPLHILFEDDDLLVVNKPAGMVVHPGAGVYNGTLVNALLHHCKTLSGVGGESRPGIVHRIDKGTSGLLIVAKNDMAHRELAQQFKDRKVKRKYIAFVRGVVELDNGKIELPIGRHPRSPKKMAVAFSQSKTASTTYAVLHRFADCTMVELRPDTGRTHQIRVHMAYLDHPLLGDAQYGKPDDRIDRPALHAGWISFRHPRTDESMDFEIPMPQDMMKVLSTLHKGLSL
jgi:23S rRNA pseudouridine1911/1915/1917 synthase